MQGIKKNNQYIFRLERGSCTLFYNNINGKLAFAKTADDLEKSFFSPALDTNIDLDAICYEQLYLAVSESCNFRCKYCRQKKTSELVNMSRADIKNAIDLFYSVASVPRSIVFFGGEPLMNIDGIRYAIEYVHGFDISIPFSMVINGSLCTKEIARFFAENQVEVIISLDGPERHHNEARVFADGKGTYQSALRGYQNLKEAGCVTGITAVIGPHNEYYFDDLIDWAIGLRPDSLGFCLPHGDENNFAMKLASFGEVHKKMLTAFDVLHRNGIYLVQVEQKFEAFLSGQPIPYECKACGKRIVACKDKRFGICEGFITKHEMFDECIEQLPARVHAYKEASPFLIPSCSSCIAYRICGGSCVYDKLTRFGRVDVPDICRCGLNKLIAEKAMEYIIENMPYIDGVYTLTAEDRRKLRKKLSI